jgi:hypothetical protein
MKLSNCQQQVANDGHRFKVVIAGRRFGKTFLSIRELCYHARMPDQTVWYITSSYRAAKMIVWKPLKARLLELRWVSKINESTLEITLKNGSVISLKGADNPDALRGASLSFVVIDEVAEVDSDLFFEVIRPALADQEGGALFIGTPKGKNNWAYDLYTHHHEFPEHWASWQFTTLEGGFVKPEEIEASRRDMSERQFRQEYEATFETFEGRVAWAFDRDKNVVKITDPDTSVLHIGCDFNVSPITAAIHVRHLDDLIQIDEVQMYSSNTQELCDEINNRYPRSKKFAYPDPSGIQRKSSAGGNTDHSILANNGFVVKSPRRHNAVKDRINSYNARLCSSDGIRHLFIDPKCKYTIESLEKFVYKEGTQQPFKGQWDHMFDAASYCVDFLFPLTKERIEDLDAPTAWTHALA